MAHKTKNYNSWFLYDAIFKDNQVWALNLKYVMSHNWERYTQSKNKNDNLWHGV